MKGGAPPGQLHMSPFDRQFGNGRSVVNAYFKWTNPECVNSSCLSGISGLDVLACLHSLPQLAVCLTLGKVYYIRHLWSD